MLQEPWIWETRNQLLHNHSSINWLVVKTHVFCRENKYRPFNRNHAHSQTTSEILGTTNRSSFLPEKLNIQYICCDHFEHRNIRLFAYIIWICTKKIITIMRLKLCLIIMWLRMWLNFGSSFALFLLFVVNYCHRVQWIILIVFL